MQNDNQPIVYFFAKSNFGDKQPDFIKIGRTRTDLISSNRSTDWKRISNMGYRCHSV